MESAKKRQPGVVRVPPGVWPVVVVGAGAAGITAAIFAARSGRRVLLLETRTRPGAKIRVSGGGRCNLLPAEVSLADFATGGSIRQVRNILFSWPIESVRLFFERDLGVPLKVEASGKIFPLSDRARDVVDSLLRECDRRGVTLLGDCRVTAVQHHGNEFEIRSHQNARIRCRRLVLATGGLSLPKTGSDGHGLQVAEALGHQPAPTHPALVPLLTSDDRWHGLAGVSLRARLRVLRGHRVIDDREGDLLFTHGGFSGPVLLDVSRHFTAAETGDVKLRVHWGGSAVPSWDVVLRSPGDRTVRSLVRDRLPRRLADALLASAGIEKEQRISALRRDARRSLVAALESGTLEVSGNEGYRTAEVTAGGIRFGEVRAKTLESRLVPGLHFAGEMLDVVGRIGGYNFLWAWVSGRRAGEAAADSSSSPRAGTR